jgi:inner membrane protein
VIVAETRRLKTAALTLFFFEIFAARRIHPLQYLFVGFAECIFYLLLLSLCEHIPFLAAYIAAAAASIGLIVSYTFAISSRWKGSFLILPVLITAYAFLYLVLRSEDYALLVGSLGLFIILSAVMALTRKIDWYSIGLPRTAPEAKGRGDGVEGGGGEKS